jgi:hypothetical protein
LKHEEINLKQGSVLDCLVLFVILWIPHLALTGCGVSLQQSVDI